MIARQHPLTIAGLLAVTVTVTFTVVMWAPGLHGRNRRLSPRQTSRAEWALAVR
jgi:hypothetical protein